MARGDLTGAQWTRLEPLLPRIPKLDRPPRDRRQVFDGIWWRPRTGRDRAAAVAFDGTVSSLGHVHCGSGRTDSSIEIDAGELMAAVPGAATASIVGLRADGPA
jgi:hypothetical protein